ncbi:MAG: PKD domain-containing protein [Candidatus Poseidoniia archaeon]|nr:PKD domain-containing protein [Candidatus Poseidoniia archaeon]
MYLIDSKIGKQVLAWALVFTLVLSIIPTAISDESDDEWFWDIESDLYDLDSDGSDDTIEIGYDPDTTCECDIDITVYIDIYDEDGDNIDSIYEEYTINNGYSDWLTQDWTPDYNGTFDFYVEMYDEWDNLEDNWSVTDVELSAMTGSPPASDDTINVENIVWAEDDDEVNNDIVFAARNKDDGIDNVEISVEFFNGLTWVYYANGSTGNDGEYTVKNASSGEYRWTASDNGTDLEEETVSYTEVDTVNNLSHQMSVEDWDNAGDYDDFLGAIFEDDDTKDDGYVEIYDADGELYDSGNTDYDYYGYDIYLLDDVEKGNYTFNLYYEEDGELLQSGWLHSYGSTSTNYDEWFEDWEYETEDTNGDGEANSIVVKYDPNTECNCTTSIEVDFSVYNNDTGGYSGGDYFDHNITGTEVDSFETDEWSPSKNGNYTFEFYLYDEDYNYEDHFNFTVYLECDEGSNDSDCDNDEWFEDWDYETEDNDGDNLDDTIAISYNPDTDCDCEVGINIYVDVYENSTGDWVDSEYDSHTINGTEEEYFEQSWTSRDSQSYDFLVELYDDDWIFEDSFWIYGVYLYQTSGAGGPGDEDEWFDWIDAYTYDADDDGYDDTAEIEYDPDTTCECDINITLVIDVYDNETGYWVNGTEEDYTIYSDDNDYWYQSWSPEYNGTFDFEIKLYDEDNNLEDEEEYLGIELHARSSGGGGGDGDYDEWFYSWDYDIDPSDTIIIGYDPDTDCDCTVTIYVYVDVYDNETGNYVDTIAAEHDINNGYSDWFEQNWTAYENGSYDFAVYLYDEDWNEEDLFWIYDVYLSSDGGGGGDEDHDEWFYEIYYGAVDENDEHQWNKVIIGYDPDTDCDCEMDIYVEAIIWDENGDYVDYSGENHTINNGYSDWFEIVLEVDEPGKYWFTVDLYDDEWNHEDQFNFTLIMSDEWFIDQFSQDGDSVRINLDPQTNYDGEIGTEYYLDVLRFNESNDDWDYIDEDIADAVITSSDNEDINFEWTAEEEGTYLFAIYMFDEHGNMEDMAEFEAEIVLNHAPEIGDLNTDRVFEGQMFNFEVDAFDADDDDLEYIWDMGNGNLIGDDSVRYGYPDDGIYTIIVSVSDGMTTTTKEFELVVENVAPTLQVSYDDFGQEGQTLSFNSQASDVSEDTVTVTWSFPDGTQIEGNFGQYQFTDDGEFLIGVTAEDEDGGRTSESLLINIENVAPTFTEFKIPSEAQEGEALDFTFEATDPGDDTIVFTIDFGDGTAPMITQDGNVSHKFAEGDTFTLVVCAKDEDGGENCREQILPVSILEQLEDEGLLPGFNLLLAISALGVVGILRRRTH